MNENSSPQEEKVKEEAEEISAKEQWELAEEYKLLAGEGDWVTLRGKQVLILPALITEVNVVAKMMQEIGEDADSLMEDTDVEGQSDLQIKMIDFCLWAICQAYPLVTRKEVEKVASLEGFQKIYKIVIAINNLGSLFSGKVMGSELDLLESVPIPTGEQLRKVLE